MVETATYANGYLQKTELSSLILYYTWDNGNMKTVTGTSEFVLLPDLSPQTYSFTSTYEYGTTPNKPSSIELVSLPLADNFPRGWYGKSSRYLPSKSTRTIMDELVHVETYRYETDEDGYVTKIFVRKNDAEEELLKVIQYDF